MFLASSSGLMREMISARKVLRFSKVALSCRVRVARRKSFKI